MSSYEELRLNDLYSLDILDSAADKRLDAITEFAAALFGVQTSLISLVDSSRQWFKSSCGFVGSETDRSVAFCDHAIREKDMMIVEDAQEDGRFSANPLVTGKPNIRFYAGAVLRGPKGYPIGTLCLIDPKPGSLCPEQKDRLRAIANYAEREIIHNAGIDVLKMQLRKITHEDPRTGLPNHLAFLDILNDALASKVAVTVVVISIDYFREFLQGLTAVEQSLVISEVKERIKELESFGWRVGATGEDGSYTAYSCGVLNDEDIQRSVLSCFARPLSVKHYLLAVSIGASRSPEHGADAEQLIDKARLAKPFNPVGAPSAIRFYMPSMSDVGFVRLDIANRLKLAVGQDALSLVFQPKFNILTHQLSGLEALLRWKDSELGVISPSDFIPIAEESDTIFLLSEWVLMETCRQLEEWREKGITVPHVAINFTARELCRQDFLSWVSSVMAPYAISPKQIRFEITERSLIGNQDVAIANMHAAIKAGFSFSLDDFGTGYSSLSEIHRLPIKELKIDRSFVKDLPASNASSAIVKAVLAMTEGLGINAVAEGVEEMEQLSFLASHGCGTVQGYLTGRPVAAERMYEEMSRIDTLKSPN